MRGPLLSVTALLLMGGCTEPAPTAPPPPITEPTLIPAPGAPAPPPDSPPTPARPEAPPAPVVPPVTPFAPPPEPLAPLPEGVVGGPDFTRVFDAVAPSVVGVVAGRMVDGRYSIDRTGTGFVFDDLGHIVTNAHIIGDAPRLRVRTVDGQVIRARLVGLDAATDLAVIDPGPLGLPPMVQGPVDALRPGAWVAALGNPLGMAHSITVGVVSALGRRTLPPGAPKLAEFIQSDVAVDAGSSGGPLVDTRARVVGLNTAVVGGKLAFSIRIDMVDTVARRLIADGTFVRGFAGIYTRRVSTKAAREAGLDRRMGVRVKGVVDDGPAHRAGLVPGDIILRFGDHAVDDPDALPWLIAATRPGTGVPVQVARGPERLSMTVQVGEALQ